ncbi:hypothetical protein [Phocaeicola sartorii]|uniref:hypothetical protein n=1 Tax=Phocaeicola sartorii TaxID=671267 RepID=UPI00162A3762|nr:hypothetical protein [Phocaeicola sartorii]
MTSCNLPQSATSREDKARENLPKPSNRIFLSLAQMSHNDIGHLLQLYGLGFSSYGVLSPQPMEIEHIRIKGT